MIQNELIKQIKGYFDLNIYETKVWLALLGKGVASAGEIAEISGVPRSRTYDVLEGLEKRGFALMRLGKPVKYIVVKPKIILEKLKFNALRNADEKVEVLSKLRKSETYKELEQLYTVGIVPVRHEEISGAIRGGNIIYSHIKEILESAKKEVIICTSTQEIQSKMRFFSCLFERFNKENIKLKIALSGSDKEIKKINFKLKIKARKTEINSRFYIADKAQILFIISKGIPPEEDLAVWLNTPFFTSSLVFMFNQAFKGK